MNFDHVKEHYNLQKNRSIKERQYTLNYNIRLFNNKLKKAFIQDNIISNATVLELGVGKGGDLKKYNDLNINFLVGLDISNISLLALLQRYPYNTFNYKCRFKCIDCFGTAFNLQKKFNLISCQFAFHYAFISEAVALTAIKNIDIHLVPKGRFIMTIPSKTEICKRIKSNNTENNLYKLIPSKKLQYICNNNEEYLPENIYSMSYEFELKDSIDKCEEYLVDDTTIKTIFEKAGYRLVYNYNFEEYVTYLAQRIQYRYSLIKDLRNLNSMEREVISLYQVYSFEKQ